MSHGVYLDNMSIHVLTKYQHGKVMELMCPNCNGDLVELNDKQRYCRGCTMVYVGEERKDSDASH